MDDMRQELDADTIALAAGATLGLKHNVNLLVDYDPRWPAAYAAEAQRLLAVLADVVVAIEHYGSTAIPGLRAKPILDILIGVETQAGWTNCKAPLESLGYDFLPIDPPVRCRICRGDADDRDQLRACIWRGGRHRDSRGSGPVGDRRSAGLRAPEAGDRVVGRPWVRGAVGP
ncbi:MAG: GrpB family protein [Anaerolineales bacterium]|nr:GrpB family protein [Anaerolineales bacterium]